MADDPLKAALETKGPEIKEPGKDDTALRTGLKLGGLTVLDARNLLLAIIVLVLAVVGLEWVRKEYRTAFWAAITLAALCLANVLWHMITLIRHRRREAALRKWAVQPLPSFEAEYFRVGPYSSSEADRKRYRRPDGADADILAWVRAAGDPILYLSGPSGAGKSSLLNASLLPALAGDQPPRHIIAIPEQGDPIAYLREALLTPGAVWKSVANDRRDEPMADLLAAACQHLERNGRRLFLLCDQFEVVLIRHGAKAPETKPFAELLRAFAAGRRKTFPGLTVLLSFRSDYDDLLKTLGLPRWVEGKNGRRVAPFSRLVARAFLADPRSGLQLAEGRLNEVLDEAEAVTGTPGLIRPIALNMLGKLLERHAGHDPGKIPRGALLSHDVRRAVEAEEVRAHARPVLRTLMSEGLRVRRTVAESAVAAGLTCSVVCGCLHKLATWQLVRCVEESDDPAQSRWEIAHDFIARLLAPVLETPLRTLAERVRPFMTPALLLIIAGTAAALWLGRENAIRAHLQSIGFHALEWGKTIRLVAESEKVTSDTIARMVDLVRKANRPIQLHINSLRLQNVDGLKGLTSLQSLNLNYWPALQNVDGLNGLTALQSLELRDCFALQNVDGLKGLTSLQSLDLSYCRALQNVDGLKGLTSLQSLKLRDCFALQNVDGLKGLTSLQSLKLSHCEALQNVDGLKGLTSLQSLELRDCFALQNVDGLKGLSSLQSLDLSSCSALQNVDGLKGLTSLQSLDLSSCSALQNVDGLKGLTSLQSLKLRDCFALQNVGVLKDLLALRELDLRSTPVRDAQLFAALRAKGVDLELDDEQKALLGEQPALPRTGR